MEAWPESTGEALHTSTFLGNPLGCRMALASLDQHQDPELAMHVHRRGAYLMHAVQSLRSPRIGNVRGVGLMVGIEIVSANGDPDGAFAVGMMKQALKNGLILLSDSPASNVIALAPPFQISDEEIDFAVKLLQQLLTA